jgi:predicted ATPase
MPIEQITVSNMLAFRGTGNDAFSLDFCKGVNVLTGSNGTGKTTLLKLLYAACKQSEQMTRPGKKSRPLDYFSKEGNYGHPLKSAYYSVTGYNLKFEYNAKHDNVSRDADSNNWQFLNIPAVYIPTTEMLSHAKGFLALTEKYNMPFDATQIDIIVNAELPETREISDRNAALLKDVGKVMEGKEVVYENDAFYVVKETGDKLAFPFEAEGFRKFGLLWKLIRNGLLESGSVLFWDEPEANINPEHMPVLVGILLELQRGGVQIFVATHNYHLARYFDVLRKDCDDLMFYDLRKDAGTINCSKASDYIALATSVLDEADQSLLDAVTQYAIGKIN